ncbi:hypothetical protein C4D60_Mb07t26870 [Musa balbisiana]|uniref:CLAVATA3/ESR (CLE)-related protein 25 n=1 Tax=Musa balbisiana TaxID=52838 RepID=A0A4S8JIA1_MUSBA|nr:hypothetical protein C4D60_Mb07t26870 [Musa balbisiana]
MRALFGGLACLFFIGLLVSMAKPGAATRIIAPPVAVPTVPSPMARPLHHMKLDPFYSSKRRVPNGPDPIHNSVVHVSPPFFACGFQENWEVRKTSRKSMRTRGMQAFFAWKMDYRIYMDLILNASNKCAIFKHSQNASHDFLAFAKVLFFMEILKVGGVFEECKLHQHKMPTQDS